MNFRSLPPFLRALGSRNYRLFFSGQVVSLMGTWMTQTASLWLSYRLSHSALLLGLVSFSSQAPIFFLGPVAGVWIDRLDGRKLLLTTQALSLLQSVLLAVFALSDRLNIEGLVLLSLLQGLINAFDMPCRQAFVIRLVDRRENLGNAIALNSSMFNLARLAGPALGGTVIAATSAGVCYVIDAFSYLPVLFSLWLIRTGGKPLARTAAAVAAMGPAGRGSGAGAGVGGEAAAEGAERTMVAETVAVPEARGNHQPGRGLADLREGWSYAFGSVPIRAIILLVAGVSFTGLACMVLLPVFARDVFGGDAKTLGALMSAPGLGALGAALYLSTRKGVRGLGELMAGGAMTVGSGLIICALCERLWLAQTALVLTGAGGVLVMASGNTVLQSITKDRMRGRVMTLLAMSFTGMIPLGNLAVGSLAGTFLGAERTMTGCGLCCAAAAVVFACQLSKLRQAVGPMLAKLDASAA